MPGRSRRNATHGVVKEKVVSACIEEFWRCSGWSEAHARAGCPRCVPKKRGAQNNRSVFEIPEILAKLLGEPIQSPARTAPVPVGSRNSADLLSLQTRNNQTTDGAQRVPHDRGVGISGLRVSHWPAYAWCAWRTSLLASERRSALNHTTSHNRPGRAISAQWQ